MKTSTITAIAIATAALFATAGATAQTTSRDEVKKEAAAANKAGKIEHGEADHTGQTDQKNVKSVKPRADVKVEAKAAAKQEAANPGDANPKDGSAGKSTAARTEVKKDAIAAKKAGETAQGEAGTAPKK